MMVTDLPSQVITPGAAGSPRWVRNVVHRGVAAWMNHPVQAATATVWIQLGLGLSCLAVAGFTVRPGPQRGAALASLAAAAGEMDDGRVGREGSGR